MPSNKSFGTVFTFISVIVFIYGLFKSFPFYVLLINFIIILFFFIMTLFNEKKLIFLNYLWLRFGNFLSKIISPIILSFIYFIIITPINFISKIFGTKYLEIKYNTENTYWKDLKDKDKINFEKEY